MGSEVQASSGGRGVATLDLKKVAVAVAAVAHATSNRWKHLLHIDGTEGAYGLLRKNYHILEVGYH